MKSQQRLTEVLIGLLVVASLLLSGCGAAAASTLPSNSAPAAPAQQPQATLDLNKVVEQYVANLPNGFGGIKPTDALKALQSDPKPFVIDVRETKEITQTIQSAVGIPLRTLTQNLDKLPAKDQAILIYCSAGHRGALAMMTLQLLGYTNVKSILGGLNSWRAAGLPLVDGAAAAPQLIGQAPQVDADLLAALDKYLTSIPDGFYGAAPTSVAKELAGDPKPVVIDVREASELTDAGYVDGSVNIPLRRLFADMSKLPQDKTTPIITYCAVGHRGAIAMMALQLHGYTNVRSIGGGLGGWVKAGLSVKE
jgi:rhodanese-related sulfurtransferase